MNPMEIGKVAGDWSRCEILPRLTTVHSKCINPPWFLRKVLASYPHTSPPSKIAYLSPFDLNWDIVMRDLPRAIQFESEIMPMWSHL